jgi:hypothetical protein
MHENVYKVSNVRGSLIRISWDTRIKLRSPVNVNGLQAVTLQKAELFVCDILAAMPITVAARSKA